MITVMFLVFFRACCSLFLLSSPSLSFPTPTHFLFLSNSCLLSLQEQKRIQAQYPTSTLDDEQELRALLAVAREHFAKEGRPPSD